MTAAVRLHTPRYLLRRNLILALLRRQKPGRFLEIGCGRGELLPHMASLGFDGVGLEISPHVFPIAAEAARPLAPRIRVESNPNALRGARFPYVFAFEVLEHLADDEQHLARWREWLEPDGLLVLSVPAHARHWTGADAAAGHYRRYEREDLRALLGRAGYRVQLLWSYGFPVTSITRRLRGFAYHHHVASLEAATRQERTLRSALDSTREFGRGGRGLVTLTEAMGRAFHWAQWPFRGTDLGDGYLVSARPD